MDIVNSYELPMIRCFNCNKPLAHLYEDFKKLSEMRYNNLEIYELLNIKNPCCREKLSCAEIIIINKPDENTILGVKNTVVMPKMTQITKIKPLIVDTPVKTINNQVMYGIPINYTVAQKRKKLSEDIYVSYIEEGTYLAY